MISREFAVKLLNDNIQNANMIKHCLASEAVLRAIALKMNQDAEEWGMAGLLHDIDVEITHGLPGAALSGTTICAFRRSI